jgi:predicted dehydrogenase/threonine dehydrogenase-like Zn-dependent dehydrogenase
LKQIIQNYKTGELKVEEVAYPSLKKSSCIIKTKKSLISAGTERTKIETAHMNLIEKAISRLDLVKTLVNNIKQEGLVFTLKKAFNKLNTPTTLGYSCTGKIVDLCDTLKNEYKFGDRVACIGEIYASHAEYNCVPKDWFVKVPDDVSDDDASFVGVGAIALNAVEISQLEPGDKVVVIGLGLLGQIVVQILHAKGVRVLGVEIDESKIEIAKNLGLKNCINPVKEDVISAVNSFTFNDGVDAVIITAASSNNLPIEIAGKISRNKGRVILVGAMPIIIPRDEYYKKELIFEIARGFGANLYYRESLNRKYPFNYTPKLMKENMANFLKLVSEKKINISKLISHKFVLDDAEKAYQMIAENNQKYIGVIFEYLENSENSEKINLNKIISENEKKYDFKDKINVGFIGAGSFGQGYILPVLNSRKDVNLVGVSTATGINASSVARKFGFSYNTTDYNEILDDKNIDTVFIMTRHDLHAKFVIEALNSGKNIFVEKPLCLNLDELEKIKEAYKKSGKILMVGFNRRFSPFIQKTKNFLANRIGPMMITYRVNAGFLPAEHWLNNDEGGGRILGEGCHFVDLMNFLVGADCENISAIGSQKNGKISDENFNITLSYKDGSIANIQYSSVGDVSFSRERLEIFCENSAVVVDNYKKGEYSRNGVVKKMTKIGRDMGHNNEVNLFVDSLKKCEGIIGFDELVEDTEMIIKIEDFIVGRK